MKIIFLFQKYSSLFPLLFVFAVFFSLWKFPSATPTLGIAFILFSLAITISSIFKKHKQAENPRLKIARDILILLITLLLILFLGGFAGMYANQYASPRFGALTGFVSAIVASFAVGYLVNRGVGIALQMNYIGTARTQKAGQSQPVNMTWS